MTMQRLERQISLAREIAIIAAMSTMIALGLFALLILQVVTR